MDSVFFYFLFTIKILNHNFLSIFSNIFYSYLFSKTIKGSSIIITIKSIKSNLFYFFQIFYKKFTDLSECEPGHMR